MKKFIAVLSIAVFFGSVLLEAKSAANVNGVLISVEEANKVLVHLGEKKVTWEKLSKNEKKELIGMIAPNKLVKVASKEKLSDKEKDTIIASYWMKKEMAKIDISDSEVKKAYDAMVKIARKSNNTINIPPFSEEKDTIRLQLKKEKVVQGLMKNASIKIY